MNWEILLQALGVVVGAVLGTTQLLARLPKSRTTLKHDLEVLKLLDRAHPQRRLIEKQVQVRIEQIYGASSDTPGVKKRVVVHQWGDFIVGLVFLFGGAWLTLYLIQDGFTWWSVLTGFLALAGLGGVSNGLEDKTPAKKPLQPASGAKSESE